MIAKETKKKPTVRGLTIALRKATALTKFTAEELDHARTRIAKLEARIELAENALRKEAVYRVVANDRRELLNEYRNATLWQRIKFLFKWWEA